MTFQVLLDLKIDLEDKNNDLSIVKKLDLFGQKLL